LQDCAWRNCVLPKAECRDEDAPPVALALPQLLWIRMLPKGYIPLNAGL